MSEATDPKAKQEFMTMIGHSLEILEVNDWMLSKTNRQSIRDGILETISELMDQRDAANARAEAAEARAAELQAALMLILDCADYTSGACGLTEMIGGVLPRQIIDRARDALKGGEE